MLTRSINATINTMIDHTLLKSEATPAAIRRLCEEAIQYQFYSVCVSPLFVSWARHCLAISELKVTTVIGFPTGAHLTPVKVLETQMAKDQGADEFDLVIPLGWLKAGRSEEVVADIRRVVDAARPLPVKVILETHLLSQDEKILGCQLARHAGAHFVKTSTGMTGGGATVEDVQLLRATVGEEMGVKASGGIRDAVTARKMIAAGANRLGTSCSVVIVEQSPDLGQDVY